MYHKDNYNLPPPNIVIHSSRHYLHLSEKYNAVTKVNFQLSPAQQTSKIQKMKQEKNKRKKFSLGRVYKQHLRC